MKLHSVSSLLLFGGGAAVNAAVLPSPSTITAAPSVESAIVTAHTGLEATPVPGPPASEKNDGVVAAIFSSQEDLIFRPANHHYAERAVFAAMGVLDLVKAQNQTDTDESFAVEEYLMNAMRVAQQLVDILAARASHRYSDWDPTVNCPVISRDLLSRDTDENELLNLAPSPSTSDNPAPEVQKRGLYELEAMIAKCRQELNQLKGNVTSPPRPGISTTEKPRWDSPKVMLDSCQRDLEEAKRSSVSSAIAPPPVETGSGKAICGNPDAIKCARQAPQISSTSTTAASTPFHTTTATNNATEDTSKEIAILKNCKNYLWLLQRDETEAKNTTARPPALDIAILQEGKPELTDRIEDCKKHLQEAEKYYTKPLDHQQEQSLSKEEHYLRKAKKEVVFLTKIGELEPKDDDWTGPVVRPPRVSERRYYEQQLREAKGLVEVLLKTVPEDKRVEKPDFVEFGREGD